MIGTNKKEMMNMRTNILAGMIIMLLMALPSAASDCTLGIFGNANEDDTINMQDVTYTELIILEYRDKTELADGKHDGKINMQDVTQIELVILGRELELTLIDSADRIVTVEKPVNKIIALSPACAEAIRAIGVEDNVVGVDGQVMANTIFFPELSELPSVGGRHNPDYEKIFELEPDILITYASKAQGIQDKLGPHITVIGLNFWHIETHIDEIKKLGYVLDKAHEAEELIDWYEGYLNTIKSRTEGISDGEKPRAYLESYWEYKVAYSGGDQMCRMAGGINIANDLPVGSNVDPEWVITQNPDIIVKAVVEMAAPGGASCGYDEDDPAEIKAVRDGLMNRAGWNEMSAVKNGRVHLITRNIYISSSCFVGLTYLAKVFHPDLFEDLDPETIHQEYLTRFHHLDYDLDEHGVFFYPPIEINGGLAGIPER